MKRILILCALSGLLFAMCTTEEKKEETSKEEENQGLQTVAEFDTRPGNVAVSQSGRVFTTMHPMEPSDIQLMEVTGGKKIPFPDSGYQKNGEEASYGRMDTPLGVRVDKNDVVWVTDMGQNLGVSRVFGFDIETKEEVFRFDFPEEIAPKGSFIQDIAVDEENKWIYLADIADPGILAIDMVKRAARRFSDKTLEAEDIDMIIDGEVIHFGGKPARVAVNPIALSDDRNTLFFGAMSGTKWYSLPTNLFRDGVHDSLISAAIKVVGDKPISDGCTTDKYGNHYFTNLQEYGIDILDSSGVLKPLIREESLNWPDNVDIDGEGWLYMVVNQLHKAPAFTGGEDQGKAPYFIKKIKLQNLK